MRLIFFIWTRGNESACGGVWPPAGCRSTIGGKPNSKVITVLEGDRPGSPGNSRGTRAVARCAEAGAGSGSLELTRSTSRSTKVSPGLPRELQQLEIGEVAVVALISAWKAAKIPLS
jgi:hypothetical protein